MQIIRVADLAGLSDWYAGPERKMELTGQKRPAWANCQGFVGDEGHCRAVTGQAYLRLRPCIESGL